MIPYGYYDDYAHGYRTDTTEHFAAVGGRTTRAQDPKLPAGQLMITGMERSNLGEALKRHGALITADPYPQEHFFERSDNYSLALKGIVAHTFSGWAVVPTYHSPTDTVANLDIPFMTAAIQSLIAPIRLLATSDARPEWKANGRPK